MFHQGEKNRRLLAIVVAKAALIHIPATNATGYHLGRVRTAEPLYRSTKGGMNMTAARAARCQNTESRVFQRYSGKHHRKIRNDRGGEARAAPAPFQSMFLKNAAM